MRFLKNIAMYIRVIFSNVQVGKGIRCKISNSKLGMQNELVLILNC